MKALTLRQPWAWAIFKAGKTIENRNWPTKFRGRIAIHAAQGMTTDELMSAGAFIRQASGLIVGHEDLVFSSILGTVEIVDCVKESVDPWFMGDYGFVLRNPIILPEPIPCKGALSLWEVPEEIADRLQSGITMSLSTVRYCINCGGTGWQENCTSHEVSDNYECSSCHYPYRTQKGALLCCTIPSDFRGVALAVKGKEFVSRIPGTSEYGLFKGKVIVTKWECEESADEFIKLANFERLEK